MEHPEELQMGVGVGHRWLVTAFALFVFLGVSLAQEAPTSPSEQRLSSSQPAEENPEKSQDKSNNPAQAELGRGTQSEKLTTKEISSEELRDLVRRAMENDQENYRKQKDLTHIERQKTEHLDGDGKTKKTEIVTKEILILYGDRMERVIERDDKPLSADERRKEDEKFDKEVGKLQKESDEQRQKRIAKYEEQSKKAREFVQEVAQAFNFKFEGEEMVNGRPAYVVSGEPRSDYKPSSREGKILAKTRGKMWIDIASTHWVKLDVEFTDTVSFGWILARVRPGTRVSIEQHLFRDDVWVPQQIWFNLDARVGIFKQLYENIDVTFRDWRKFSSEAKILDYSELEQKKPDPSQAKPPEQN
jgi:hypothetical protein